MVEAGARRPVTASGALLEALEAAEVQRIAAARPGPGSAIVRAPFGTYVLAILTDGQVDNALFVELSSAVYAYLDEQS